MSSEEVSKKSHHKFYHYLEVGANIGGCIPIIGTKIILARLGCCTVVAITGVGLKVIASIGQNVMARCSKKLDFKIWELMKDEGEVLAKHGLLNVGSSIMQLAVGHFTFNLGNLFLHYLKRNFNPFISYEGHPVSSTYFRYPMSLGAWQ